MNSSSKSVISFYRSSIRLLKRTCKLTGRRDKLIYNVRDVISAHRNETNPETIKKLLEGGYKDLEFFEHIFALPTELQDILLGAAAAKDSLTIFDEFLKTHSSAINGKEGESKVQEDNECDRKDNVIGKEMKVKA